MVPANRLFKQVELVKPKLDSTLNQLRCHHRRIIPSKGNKAWKHQEKCIKRHLI